MDDVKAAVSIDSNVEVTDGDLDTTAESSPETKTLEGGTLKYKAAFTGESYSATASGVTYTPATGGEELFTLSGVANVDGVDINNKIVTVNASNLSGGSVTITGDYTLALGKGMSESETVTANYSEGTLTTAGKSAGYELSDKSISYTAGTSKTINFSGVKGTNLTINTGAGNDTLTGGSGNDTFICKPNEGTDTIADFAAGDLLQIVDGTFSDSSFSDGKLK